MMQFAQNVANPGAIAPPGGGNPALTAHQIQQLMAHRQQVQAAQLQQQQQKYLELQRYRQMMEQQKRQGPGSISGENPLGTPPNFFFNKIFLKPLIHRSWNHEFQPRWKLIAN